MNDMTTTADPVNIGERIRQLRLIEAIVKKKEAEFEASMKDYDAFIEGTRAFLLQYLNETGQRSAQTEHGGISKKTKPSFRIVDKDAWRRHVIGMEMWELIEWRAAAAACEEFTSSHNGEAPPGLFRDARLILSVTAPIKPRKRKAATGVATSADEGIGVRDRVLLAQDELISSGEIASGEEVDDEEESEQNETSE